MPENTAVGRSERNAFLYSVYILTYTYFYLFKLVSSDFNFTTSQQSSSTVDFKNVLLHLAQGSVHTLGTDKSTESWKQQAEAVVWQLFK